jgi:hypothetical protein
MNTPNKAGMAAGQAAALPVDDPLTPDEHGDYVQALQFATAADDADKLHGLLLLAPYDSTAYINHLQALADAESPTEPCDPQQVRAGTLKAIQASALPGHTISADMAGAIVDGLHRWHILATETPEQRAIRQAFAEARRLIDLHGDEDPRTFSAVIRAIELQDPGCCDRMLAESGIHLPEPTHVNADGQPLLALDQIAQALDTTPENLMPHIERMEAAGMDVRQQPAGRIQ